MRFKNECSQMELKDDTVFIQHAAKSRKMSCQKLGICS